MNTEEFAKLLDGSEYPFRLSKDQKKCAKKNNLLVVFGASDDLVEFEGYLDDELGCYNVAKFNIDKEGVIDHWKRNDEDDKRTYKEALRYFQRQKNKQFELIAKWCVPKEISWTYEVISDFDLKPAPFKVMEDGEVYCIGLVLDMSELLK